MGQWNVPQLHLPIPLSHRMMEYPLCPTPLTHPTDLKEKRVYLMISRPIQGGKLIVWQEIIMWRKSQNKINYYYILVVAQMKMCALCGWQLYLLVCSYYFKLTFFYRPNLYLEVRIKTDYVLSDLKQILRATKDNSRYSCRYEPVC